MSASQQPAVRTIARLPGCWAVAACRSGFVYCPCSYLDEAGGGILRISPAGAVEVLFIKPSTESWHSIAASPDGSSIFIGTKDGELLTYSPPWADAQQEVILSGQGVVSQLRACAEG
jgi:hypothetical protein